jgi:putative ABC transport system ATP-binding protein
MSKKTKVTQKVIEAKEIWKIYNEGKPSEVQALRGVSFDVNEGEIVAVMGESGSGKTTLLNCISGIDQTTRGSIFIDGKDLSKMKDNPKTEYRAQKMGFIFQTFNLIPVLTALENVELPLLVNGVKPKIARKRAISELKAVGLGERMDHKPSELSGGQRQRVTIARALVNDPAVIWADEPTGNLDSETADEIMDLIINLNKEKGTTVVMVTHSKEIADYAQRIVQMDSGKIVS